MLFGIGESTVTGVTGCLAADDGRTRTTVSNNWELPKRDNLGLKKDDTVGFLTLGDSNWNICCLLG